MADDKTTKLTVKNVHNGPRGLNTVAGPVFLEKDQSADVEMTSAEIESAKKTGWFDIDGSAVEGDPSEIEGLQKQAGDLGVNVDKRWGAPRLREEISKAKAGK